MLNFKKHYLAYLGYFLFPIFYLLGFFGRPFMKYGHFNRNKKTIYLKTRISNTAKFMSKKNIDIQDNVWIWHHSIIDGTGGIKIEEGVQIGAWVGIFTHSSHHAVRLNGAKYFEMPLKDRIGYEIAGVTIGAYSFIGSSSIILPGVVIGKGCVVSVGSVVNKSFPDYSIISGNPAKLIGNTQKVDKFFHRNHSPENYYENNNE